MKESRGESLIRKGVGTRRDRVNSGRDRRPSSVVTGTVSGVVFVTGLTSRLASTRLV